MFALETEPVLSVNRRPTLAAVPAAEPVFSVFTATTASETLTVWLSPPQEAVTTSGTSARYGIICANNPVNFTDPLGLTKLTVNGEIWETPIKGDLNHPHMLDGVDQGQHLHGPDGKKFFPDTGMIRDSNGNWSRVSNSFLKRFNIAAQVKGLSFGIALPLMFLDDLDLFLRSREQGRTFMEQIKYELEDARPIKFKKKCPEPA